MGRILFALFTIVPLIEIACFILIGQAGVLVTALLGAFLIRMQGLALLTEIRQTMGRGQLPARAMGDAIMVGVAGALLIAPGYFTDLLGILLLVPPVRSLIYRFLAARMTVVTPARMRPQRPGVIDLDDSDWRPR
jgi:UPF0716 protein FxsA